MEKILLDTDIGTDIDDAITISYLLKQKRCELLGVTVTGGETEKRAALASVMCRAAGRRIYRFIRDRIVRCWSDRRSALRRRQKF